MPEVIWNNQPQGQKARVFVGGCIERGDGSSFRAKAHAHCRPLTNKCLGWICVRSWRRLGIIVENENGQTEIIKPSKMMLHELAHIISEQGHSQKFYQTVRAIGGAIDREAVAYQKALYHMIMDEATKQMIYLEGITPIEVTKSKNDRRVSPKVTKGL